MTVGYAIERRHLVLSAGAAALGFGSGSRAVEAAVASATGFETDRARPVSRGDDPVSVSLRRGDYSIDNRYSLAALSGEASNKRSTLVMNPGRIYHRLQSRFDASMAYRQRGTSYDIRLDSIEIVVETGPFDILMAKELGADDCLYNAVLRHELAHMVILNNAIEEVLPQIRQTVAAYRQRTRFSGAGQQAFAGHKVRILDGVKTAVLGVLKQAQNNADRGDAVIDSPESIEQQMGGCANRTQFYATHWHEAQTVARYLKDKS